ncbi:MAG: TMEM43 family protein [bacterium]|nr:TMEM43 family protein [bacterium]
MNILIRSFFYLSRTPVSVAHRFACGILILAVSACGGPLGGIESVETAEPGRPAYAVGVLKGDFANDFDFLTGAPYLTSEREVEMYSYVLTGGESGSPACESAWTTEPDLKIGEQPACSGKRNRRSYVPNRKAQAELAVVAGDVTLPLAAGWTVRGVDAYAVQPEDIVENQRLKSHDGYFYFNQYCIDAPKPECERLRFTTIRFDPQQEYLVVGALAADGKSLGPFQDEKGEEHFYIAPLAHLAEIQ